MSEFIVTHVKPGETLSGIAARYGVNVDDLQKWNRIENPDLVLVGQKIVVYNTSDAAGTSVPGSAESRTSSDSPIAINPQDIAVGGAIVLGLLLLLLLFRRKRRNATSISRVPSRRQPQPVSPRETPVAKGPDTTPEDPRPWSAAESPTKSQFNNDGRLVRAESRYHYRGEASVSRAPPPSQPQPASVQAPPVAKGQDNTLGDIRPSSVADPLSKPQVNDGERLVSSKLRRRYRNWILIDNVMLPLGQGTTQIDHILVSPHVVFLIETKDMNGWVFGGPGDRQWTQSYAASRWSRKAGIKSKRFKFYNPLRQNEGHAKSLVRHGIVDRWRLRPIVVFVGDSEMKTADKFLPFEEHEEIARQNNTWRMRGVVCMSLKELRGYIEFSIKTSSDSELARQQMETIRDKIRAVKIPMTAESHAKHVDFVRSVKEMNSR